MESRLELKFYSALCSVSIFKIDGVNADIDDFGNQEDLGRNDPDREDYCCKNMQFIPKDPKEEILLKYNITESEYEYIAGILRDGLSFGNCGWCA